MSGITNLGFHHQLLGAAWPCLQIWAGYAVVIAIPGPNMMLVGAIAACRGFRGVVPMMFGIGAGAGLLVATICCIVGQAVDLGALRDWLTVGSSALLLFIAFRLGKTKLLSATHPDQGRRNAWTEILTGVSGGLLNPITASYFSSYLLGHDSARMLECSPAVLSAGVFVIAVVKLSLVALLLSRQRARMWVCGHLRFIRLGAASVVTILAGTSFWPVLQRIVLTV